jgi:hypothetical protein
VSERQSIKAIEPFFRFRGFPNQHELISCFHDGQILRNQDQACTSPIRDEVSKVARHGTPVVRHRHVSFTRRQSQHHIIVKAVQTSFVSGLKINLRSASTHCPHDWFKT